MEGNLAALELPVTLLFDQYIIVLAGTDVALIVEHARHVAVALARRGIAIDVNDLVAHEVPHPRQNVFIVVPELFVAPSIAVSGTVELPVHSEQVYRFPPLP